jgi:hypothetical protein
MIGLQITKFQLRTVAQVDLPVRECVIWNEYCGLQAPPALARTAFCSGTPRCPVCFLRLECQHELVVRIGRQKHS